MSKTNCEPKYWSRKHCTLLHISFDHPVQCIYPKLVKQTQLTQLDLEDVAQLFQHFID